MNHIPTAFSLSILPKNVKPMTKKEFNLFVRSMSIANMVADAIASGKFSKEDIPRLFETPTEE
jgi:hypothetical protein